MARSNQYEMQDTRSQYGELNIPPQSQPEPGLDTKLQPQADHGIMSYVGSGRLEGRKALITGADSGIGRAVAIAFAREGADVALSYLPVEQEDADITIEQIEAAGRRAVAIPGDITDESFCEAMVKRAVEELGPIDILVNNAGRQRFVENVEDLTTEQFSGLPRRR